MKSKRLTPSIVALALVAAIALGYAHWARKAAPFAGSAPVGSARARLAPSAFAALPTKDPCAEAPDRCACAADHGAELLAACFPERALQVIAHAPTSCNAPALLGVHAEALAALERGDEASALAVKVVQADPKNRDARRALAIAAMGRQDFASTDTTLAALITEDPKDVDSLFYQALSQRRRDHYNGAREGFLRVLRLNAQHIDARFNLVTLTASAGAAQEAEHHYQELEQIAPVGDARLAAARAALRSAPKASDAPLPVLHEGAAAPSVAPSR